MRVLPSAAKQVLFALLIMTSLSTATTSHARDCSVLKATGNPEYPPYLFHDPKDDDKLIGANTEIMRMIGEAIGVKIEVDFVGPWSRAQKEVREGRYDLLAGAFFTVPRAQYMDYVYPAFLNTQSVVWTNKERPISNVSREDLIGKKGVTVIHNSFGQEFDSFAKANLDVDKVPNLRQGFDMLNLGRVNYLLYELSPAQAYSSIWGIADQVTVSGEPISAEGLYLTLSHRSPCNTGELRGKLVKAVHEIIESGKAQAALQKGLSIWRAQN